MEGWIKIHRDIMSNPDYLSEPFTRIMAFIDLNLLANHKPGRIYIRGVRVEIGRGQIGVSRQTLAERWRWSPGKVTRFLDDLENDGKIVQQKTNVNNCISLVNYKTEQASDTADRTADDTTDGTPNDTANSTADDTPNGRQTDANKNDKKNKNEENIITHTDNLEYKTFPRTHDTPETHTRARAMLDWLAETYPAMMAMPEPLTEETAGKIIAKYHHPDITRIFADMHNKGADRRKNTLTSFYSFAGHDTILRERKAVAGKRFTYGEICDMVGSGRYRQEDFTTVEVDGKKLWVKITDQINANHDN